MDLYVLLVMVLGAALVIFALAGIVLGIRRMQGRRSRFDGLFETFVRAQGASVYPPSLRGNPDPLIEEVRDTARADAAVRGTPGDDVDSNEDHARAG